jgi:hypothetical protein
MRVPSDRWLTAQETAAHLDTTSAEVCRLLGIGRLSGTKQKDTPRGGTAQWLVDPKFITKEKKTPRRRARTRTPARQPRRRTPMIRARISQALPVGSVWRLPRLVGEADCSSGPRDPETSRAPSGANGEVSPLC